MRTSEIQRKASGLARKGLPGYTVYQALCAPDKREAVAAQREGRELTHLLKTRMPPAVAKRGHPAEATSAMAPATAPATVAAPVPTTALARVDTATPGETAFVHIGETRVDVVINVHGKLVLERHRRPR